MTKKKKPFVLLAIFFTVVLLFLFFWVIRQNSGNPGELLLIHDVVLSTEIDDRRLTGAVSRFPFGSRQMVLRFNYSKASEGAEIRVLWFVEDKLVRSDSYPLTASSGYKVYSLVLENGQPLPKGSYSVGILNGSERISDFRFEIY